MKTIKSPSLTLASQSPQRRALLSSIGIPFTCWTPSQKEVSTATNVIEQVQEIAHNKAVEALTKVNSTLILTADTLVERDGVALGKPKDIANAKQVLQSLMNREHAVHTALCVHNTTTQTWHKDVVTTLVQFEKMTDKEIDWILSAGEWKDAAGAYKIQGRIACFVRNIAGSYTNVLGLPMVQLYGILFQYFHHAMVV